ncbi:MAG: HU family DNA-binding protein [Bacteroidota bacterium]
MRKTDIVNEIMNKTGIEKVAVEALVEEIMATIKSHMVQGENVYLRGFGTFQITKRAKKLGRNITKGTSISIPAHYIPTFKPAKAFAAKVKTKVKVK